MVVSEQRGWRCMRASVCPCGRAYEVSSSRSDKEQLMRMPTDGSHVTSLAGTPVAFWIPPDMVSRRGQIYLTTLGKQSDRQRQVMLQV